MVNKNCLTQLGCFIILWAIIFIAMSFFFLNTSTVLPIPWDIVLGISIIGLFVSIGLILYARPELKKYKSVIDIIRIREEVTVSNIQQETGLDRDYIVYVIKDALLTEQVYGALSHDDEKFIRNTSPRPHHSD